VVSFTESEEVDHMRRMLVVALLLVSVIGSAQTAAKKKQAPQQLSLSDEIDRIRACVARVVATFPQDPKTHQDRWSAGTGFFIDSSHVVTADHVIHPKGIAEEPDSVSVTAPIPTNGHQIVGMNAGYPATAIGRDQDHDIALLEAKNTQIAMAMIGSHIYYVGACNLDDHLLHDGESVFTSGFPLGLPYMITTSGAIASSDPIGFTGGNQEDVKDTYWVDIHVNEGNSGGPLFSRTSGSVVGMVDAYEFAPVRYETGENVKVEATLPNGQKVPLSLENNSGIGLVVPSEYIVALLKNKKIDYNKGGVKEHPPIQLTPEH
jgi:S1-C subfamily serine protease